MIYLTYIGVFGGMLAFSFLAFCSAVALGEKQQTIYLWLFVAYQTAAIGLAAVMGVIG